MLIADRLPTPARWVTALATEDKCIFAACNDGTMWAIGGKFGIRAWVEIVSIPQPDASND